VNDLEQARRHRLGAFTREQCHDLDHLMLGANVLRLALEHPHRVEPTLNALYLRIGELTPDDEELGPVGGTTERMFTPLTCTNSTLRP